ncbi:MAG TPA: extracellular solute-binding protein [Aggregatilinea sp.]|jgi:multiple sugar transport system substrate-binding protein|uniref:ABC transporter substrate-binding protein n=1 Tax=Aggregatilinea sp. TaxID=2806333 RepID=UPI002D117BEC|nr:extracellular solute-binding protein [Aggregatilinea sp.]HML21965.1 extracellular solute-binding protein [Aggregatilinea sp.]
MRSKFAHVLVLLLIAAMVIPAIPAQARQDKVQLTLWHMEGTTNRIERIQTLLDEFNASQSEIEVTQEPQNWGEIYTKAPAAIAAGNAPDMLFAIPDFTPILKDLGAVQPVEDFVAELDAEHPFYPAMVEQYTYDDHTWAVPLYNMAQNMWYRKSVLEAAGIEVPTTWDEWLAAAEALTTDEQYGVGLPAAKNLYTDQVVYDFMIGAGASEIYNDDGSLRFNNPETVEAYDMYNQLLQYSPADSPNWAWGEAEACFANATCAMVIQFTVISTYDTQAEGDAADLGVAPIPYKEGVEDPGTIAYANAVMLLTDDPAKQEAAKTFISWLLQPENYGRFLNMEPGLFLPVTEDGATADSFWEDPLVVKYHDQVQTMIDNSTSGRLFGFTSGRTFPSIASISAQNLLAQTLQLVAIDGKPAADAVAEGQSIMESAIED